MMEVTFLPQLVPLLPYTWPGRLLSRRSCGSQDLTRSNRFLLRHLFRPSLHPRSPSLVVDGTEMGICCCGESGRRQRETRLMKYRMSHPPSASSGPECLEFSLILLPASALAPASPCLLAALAVASLSHIAFCRIGLSVKWKRPRWHS